MRRTPKTLLAVAVGLLVAATLGGCSPESAGLEKPLPMLVSPSGGQPAGEDAAPTVVGDLKLTFAGSPPTPVNFSLPNGTKVLVLNHELTANKSFTFVPAQTNGTGKDVWKFDCTESSDGAIQGTATYKRTMQWTNQVFDKQELHKSWGTWTGKVAGKRASDGAVNGSVTGDYVSGSLGGTTHTTPFAWKFSGQ